MTEIIENKSFLAVIICFVCALVFYELSGIIGKEMMTDKHLDGKGQGYQGIIFGKDRKKSLIVNVQYNVFAPLVYTLLIAALLQYLNVSWLLNRVMYTVPCYYIVRAVMINGVSGKHWLYNWKYEMRNAVMGTCLALFVQKVLILSGKPILPTVEEFRTQMWLVFIALAYGFLIRVYGKTPSIRQDKVCTNEMKQGYIREKYTKFQKKYHGLIKETASGNFLQSVIYAVMIYEDYNRPRTHRWCENIFFRLGRRPMTLGVMQVMTSVFIDDARSVELGSKKIRQSFERFVQEKIDEYDGDYEFGFREPEDCIREICMDYNGAEDYVDAVRYIYSVLCPWDTDLDEADEIRQRCDNLRQGNYGGEDVAATTEDVTYIETLDELEEITECCQRRVISGTSEVLNGISVSEIDSLVVEGEENEIQVGLEGCILLSDCNNITFRNLNFRALLGDVEDVCAVVQILNCNNIRWELCKFEGFQRTVFHVMNSTNVVVKAADFNNTEGNVFILDDSEAELEHIAIEGIEKEEATLSVKSSVLEISNACFNGLGKEEHVIQKENSKLTCKNVVVN